MLPTGQGAYVRSLVLNLRRPIFQDIRVREALQLSFDFEWMNAQSFNLYARIDSAFSNSDFAATGQPSPGQLAILEPYRVQLPTAVFGPPYENPRTDTGPTALRDNLRRARDLLAQAGWRPGADKLLRNAQGQMFSIELLNNDADIAASLEPWLVNLAKLGIRAKLRQVDFALFVKRMQTYDFDITQLNFGEFLLPSATLLKASYGSDQVDKEGLSNLGGIRDPALDATMQAMAEAVTMAQLLDAAPLRPRADAAALRHSLVAAAGFPHGVVGPLRHSGAGAALLHRDVGQQQRQSLADRELVERARHAPRPGQTMTRYIATRLLLMLPTLLGVLTATFILIQFVPGGPVEQAISELRQQSQERGHGGELDAVQIEAIKKLYGFDKPPLERFWLTVSSFARFDFGTSFQSNQECGP